MREKLNENPMMQMVVVGVLIVVVGFLFMTRMRSSTDSASTALPATDPGATAGATAPATATATDPAATDPTATGAAVPSAAPPAGATSTFKAGPGLPKPVVKAYDSGNAIALLVTKQAGLDDKEMRKAIGAIKGRNDVTVITVRVHDVAEYSRITEGVDLNRVPALVVIQPKKLTGKNDPPKATVSYGYRTPKSVTQAIDDQLYHGKRLGYSPK